MITQFSVTLPGWFQGHLPASLTIPAIEDRMAFVINLARLNIRNGTGGPFGSAIFDAGGNLVSAGVNLVETGNCSILHAEMIAIALAQKSLGRYDLSGGRRFFYELVASAEPCAMCLGATPWSGVSRLVCGARDADARAVGFDEGPKTADWQEGLTTRGITVVRDVLRNEAAGVLQEYLAAGGIIYNAGRAPVNER
jgi:tRNA(Arg) A34 adenosine deaminase TadA